MNKNDDVLYISDLDLELDLDFDLESDFGEVEAADEIGGAYKYALSPDRGYEDVDVYINSDSIVKNRVIEIEVQGQKKNLYIDEGDTIVCTLNLPAKCRIVYKSLKEVFENGAVASFRCEILVDYSVYNLFKEIWPTNGKFEKFKDKIETFSKMSLSHKRKLIETHQRSKVSLSNSGYEPITKKDDLLLFYDSCIHTYPEEIQKAASFIVSELKTSFHRNKEEYDLLKRLSYLLNIENEYKPLPETSYDDVMKILDERIYGMDKVKRIVAERIMMAQYTEQNLKAVLLVGSSGVGKTSLAESVAYAYNYPYIEVKLDGKDATSLSGLDSSYQGAKPGEIAESLFKEGRKNVVLCCDELDKLAYDKERQNPYGIFNSMLGPQRVLHDEYIGVDIDVSQTVFIATANSLEDIPSYLLDRFSLILELAPYSLNQKVEIAYNYSFPKFIKSCKNIEEGDIVFSKNILLFMAKRYCDDTGARKMNSCVENLIPSIVTGWVRGEYKKPFVVTEQFVMDCLDELFFKEKKNLGFVA